MLRNIIMFVALALPRLILVKVGHLKQEQSGVLSKLMMYVGIPLAQAVFGNYPAVLTAVIILNIITNVLMKTLGVYLVSGDRKQMSIKSTPELKCTPKVSNFWGAFQNLP